MASSALSLLIKTPPKDLVHKTPSHHRLLVDVLQALATENLAKSTFVDDIDALYTLFDVCCDNGLGCYVIDYVTSVCLDPSVTSNDPLESFMSDGACIIKWAERCVGDLRRKLLSTPQLCRLATAPAGGSSTMLLALARLHTIASALGVLRQHGDGNAQEGGIQEEATLLMQLCTVALWCSTNQIHQQRSLGTYASEQEWRTMINKRRDATGQSGLFLDRVLLKLRQQHGLERCQYPPPSLDHALKDWFAHGNSAHDAWTTKLQLLCYMLVDAGMVHPDAFTRTGVLKLTGWQWQLCAGQCLLDHACAVNGQHTTEAKEAAAAIAAGCGLAVGAARPGVLELHTLEQLTTVGHPQLAVALLENTASCIHTVDDAFRAQRLLLADGRLAAALQRGRHDVEMISEKTGERVEQVVEKLLGPLIEWCMQHNQLQDLLAQPLTTTEEQHLLATLVPHPLPTSTAAISTADAAVAYLVHRGRTAEALLLAQRVKGSIARGGVVLTGHAAATHAQLQQQLADAVRVMPPCQTHVLVGTGGGVPTVQVAGVGHTDGTVAVAPQAETLGGASAARVIVHPQNDGPVPLVSHVLWGSTASTPPATATAVPVPTPVFAAQPPPESMVFGGSAPRALPLQATMPTASMEDAMAALFAGAPKDTQRKQHSKRARLLGHKTAW